MPLVRMKRSLTRKARGRSRKQAETAKNGLHLPALSCIPPPMHPDIHALFPYALRGEALPPSMLAHLPALLPAQLADLTAAARIAASVSGVNPFRCGILNAKSGLCGEACRFCAQSRRHAAKTPVHPLVPRDVMVRQAERFAAAGLRFMGIVTSGGALPEEDFDRVCEAAAFISVRVADIGLCASVGALTPERARALRQAGFTSCHHNLESSRSFYPSVCTTHDHESRVITVKNAAAAGLRLCCGCIFGMGESWEQRFEFAAELAALRVDYIHINLLTPIPGSPMGNRPLLPVWEALAVLACMRLMHPGSDIICCGGRTRILRRYDALLFFAGANGLMTGNYLTIKGNSLRHDRAMLETLGFADTAR